MRVIPGKIHSHLANPSAYTVDAIAAGEPHRGVNPTGVDLGANLPGLIWR